MMAEWLAAVAVAAVACAVLFGPGALAGFGLGLRGLRLWAMAPALSSVVVGGLAVVFGAVGIPWSVAWVLVGCGLVAAAAWASGWALGARRSRSSGRSGRTLRPLLVGGLVVGSVSGAVRFGLYLGHPDAISQTNDAMFHLNAVRWIIETADASSLHLSGVIGASGVYPAGWHGLTSVVVMLTGSDIAVAVNAMSLAMGFLAWPLGIAWLVRSATRSVPTAAVAAALSTSLLTFPMLMLEWGVLYPYALSVALLPAAVAVVIDVDSVHRRGTDGPGGVKRWALAGILLLAGVGALAVAQPATLLSWGVLMMSWGVWRVARARRRRAAAWTALVAAGMLLAAVWFLLSRSTSGSHWAPYRTRVDALVDVAVNSQLWLPPAVGVSILCLLGLIVAVRSARLRWLATAWIAVGALYVAAASIASPVVRTWVVGAWYADPYRFAALAPIVVVPLAAVGLRAVVVRLVTAISSRRDLATRAMAWSVAAVAAVNAVVVIAAPVTMMPNVFENRWDERSRYSSTSQSFLSPDERALLSRLDDVVPADAMVIANPSTGAAFGYALSGRDVYPRTWQPPAGQWQVIAERLRDAATDPSVCTALRGFDSPAFVLDFGAGEASPGRYIMPGMTGLAGQQGFELVDHEGRASLWRITACDG